MNIGPRRAADEPDSLTASGQTLGATNFGPTNGSRDVSSIYWEIRLPVTSSAWNAPGLYSLELDYRNNLKTSVIPAPPKGRSRRALATDRLALTIRATYSEAYRAPTLNDLFAGALPVPWILPTRGDRSPNLSPLGSPAVIRRCSLRRPMSGRMARSSLRANGGVRCKDSLSWRTSIN